VLQRLQHVGVTGRKHVLNKNKIEATTPLIFLTSTSSALQPTVHERQSGSPLLQAVSEFPPEQDSYLHVFVLERAI